MPPRPTREKKKPGPKPGTMSAERRQQLSESAKQKHAEGKLGGAKFGALGGRGNTREKRLAAQEIAEHIKDPKLVSLMKKTLEDSQHETNSMKTRMDGVKIMTDIERETRKLEIAEEKHDVEKLDRQTLLDLLSQKLTSGASAAAMRGQMEATMLEEENIIDATVVEDDED